MSVDPIRSVIACRSTLLADAADCFTRCKSLAVLIPLSPEILLAAYAAGIFPMAESAEDPELFWVDPRRRGILPLDAFHVARRLRRVVRQRIFEVRCDSAFTEVMLGCSEASEKRPNTWINDEIV